MKVTGADGDRGREGGGGVGTVDVERRAAMKAVLMEIIVKLHKMAVGEDKIKARPVGRAYASQMKAWETLVGKVLVQVLEEDEGEAESGAAEGGGRADLPRRFEGFRQADWAGE